MAYSVTKSITIHAPAYNVWQALTDTAIMRKWWADFDIIIETNWKIGSAITFNYAMYGKQYNDEGTVLKFEPLKALFFTYCSSISPKPVNPADYPVFGFEMNTFDDTTTVTFTHTNIATVVDYEHSDFYWNVTLIKLKEIAEGIQ